MFFLTIVNFSYYFATIFTFYNDAMIFVFADDILDFLITLAHSGNIFKKIISFFFYKSSKIEILSYLILMQFFF